MSCLEDSLSGNDMIPTAKISINSSIYLGFTGRASAWTEPIPQGAIRSGVPSENTTVLINECINFDECDINLGSIDFEYQYAIGYCGSKQNQQYPSFQLYLVNADEKYRQRYLIYQKDYNSTDIKSYCYDDHEGEIASYSPLQKKHINVNISLNYSVYQFQIHFINRQYNSHLYFGTLSLQINAKYLVRSLYDLPKRPIDQLIILILFSCIIICCCIVIILCVLYKRKNKQFKRYKKRYDQDYHELINLTDPMDDKCMPTKVKTSDEGEMDVNTKKDVLYSIDIDNDDQMYTKPWATTTNHDIEILHFHYMEYIEEGESQLENDKPKDDRLYHEKQELELCLMHALNSLLQNKIFTREKMNEICNELAPKKIINPHKSVLQTGNYDANVLMMALNKMNIEVEWFDARNVKQLDLNDDKFLKKCDDNILVGFILNIPSKSLLKMVKRRHWIAIKEINGVWYDLDSKLKGPKQYRNTQQLTRFLISNLTENNAELMICRKKKSKKNKKLIKQKAKINW